MLFGKGPSPCPLPIGWGEGGRWRRLRDGEKGLLAVSFFEGGEQFGLMWRWGQIIGGVIAPERLPGEPGGNLERAGDLAEVHFSDFLVAKIFEVTQTGGAELLGDVPFLFTVFAGAAGPMGGILGLKSGLGLGVGLSQSGIVIVETLVPSEFAGPVSDGPRGLAEGVSHGRERAGLAELEVGEEGGEGARGFAGLTREGGWGRRTTDHGQRTGWGRRLGAGSRERGV